MECNEKKFFSKKPRAFIQDFEKMLKTSNWPTQPGIFCGL